MAERRRREESLAPYWSPYEMFQQMGKTVEDLRMGMENFWFPRLGMEVPRIPVIDVADEGNQYVLEADLPGMAKGDVDIKVERDYLVISAQKTSEMEEKKEDYVRRERGQTSFYRKMSLPPDVNVDRIDAHMENGVLRVVLPKMEKPPEEGGRKVEVK